jgi:tetratricopeptide (TPR) repeat protein
MKSSLLICFLAPVLMLLYSNPAPCQYPEVEKLRFDISHETSDTSRIKLLVTLALHFSLRGDSGQMICLKKAYDLSKKTNFRYGLIYGLYYEALLLQKQGDYDRSLEKFKRCIAGLDSLGIIQAKNRRYSCSRSKRPHSATIICSPVLFC